MARFSGKIIYNIYSAFCNKFPRILAFFFFCFAVAVAPSTYLIKEHFWARASKRQSKEKENEKWKFKQTQWTKENDIPRMVPHRHLPFKNSTEFWLCTKIRTDVTVQAPRILSLATHRHLNAYTIYKHTHLKWILLWSSMCFVFIFLCYTCSSVCFGLVIFTELCFFCNKQFFFLLQFFFLS